MGTRTEAVRRYFHSSMSKPTRYKLWDISVANKNEIDPIARVAIRLSDVKDAKTGTKPNESHASSRTLVPDSFALIRLACTV